MYKRQEYVSRVLYPKDDGYVGVFYKKTPGTRRFCETDEDAFFRPQDILKTLQPTDGIQTSSRFKNMISFKNDMDDLILF